MLSKRPKGIHRQSAGPSFLLARIDRMPLAVVAEPMRSRADLALSNNSIGSHNRTRCRMYAAARNPYASNASAIIRHPIIQGM